MTDKEKEKHGNAQGEGEKGKDEGSRESEHEEHKKKKRKEEALEELKADLEGKEKEIEDLKEKLLYHQADFDNFKKLKAKEKQEVLRFGNETLIKELLPVIDNLERAIEHAGKTDEAKAIAEGVALTLNGFLKVLEKFDVSRVEAKGKKFDPNLHEAVYQEESEQVEPGTVIAEFQKGYMMDGRLLRPSMVSVAKMAESE
ncbi:MAG: nucleotide exchange factor GrpE [Syntrophorhabdales bacterium]|jgi:molecular chaperone GrpE